MGEKKGKTCKFEPRIGSTKDGSMQSPKESTKRKRGLIGRHPEKQNLMDFNVVH
jgi:hypothetical protein